MCKKQVFDWGNQKLALTTRLLRLTAPVLSIAGLIGMSVPSMAATASYANDYRSCAGRLLKAGVSEQAASQACATALNPRDLSTCVADISKQTQIAGVDALGACRRGRQPRELATCVVSVSKNTQGAVNSDVLNYCSRSLLPVKFAQCVVGLRSEINLAPIQALDTCIDGSDRIGGLTPTSTTSAPGATEFSPTFQTQPLPTNTPR